MSEIKASALIYCRTYCCDYDTGFLLKPDDFSDVDVNWAKEYILSATSYCDNFNGIRQVIFGNQKYLIFGIVGVLDNLFEKYEPDKQELKQYATDKNGRNIKCFIGYVCHMQDKEIGQKPVVDVRSLINIFEEHIAKDEVWKNNSRLRLTAAYEYSLEVEKLTSHQMLGEREHVTGAGEDQSLFEAILEQISGADYRKLSLCTNLYNVKMMQDERFSYVSAEASTIERYKKKLSEADAPEECQEIVSADETCKCEVISEETDTKGKTGIIVLVVTIIAVIIIVFLMLL